MRLLILLPALLTATAWWLTAAMVLRPQFPLTRGLCLTLVAIGGFQVVSFAICGVTVRHGEWPLSLFLGALLLFGSALFFFTPVLGIPFLLVADAVAAGREWIERPREK